MLVHKKEEVSPIFKVGESFTKGGYRPIYELPTLYLMGTSPSHLPASFSKNDSTQNTFIKLTEYFHTGIDDEIILGAFSLWISYDCLSSYFIIIV